MKNEFTMSIVLAVEPEKLFRAWLKSKEHSGFTGSPAKITSRAGGAFRAWDGYISGKTIEIGPERRILQTWRTTEFSAGDPDSKLEIIFEKAGRGTRLTLHHFNIPYGDVNVYKQGWKDYYFKPMKEYYSSVISQSDK